MSNVSYSGLFCQILALFPSYASLCVNAFDDDDDDDHDDDGDDDDDDDNIY